MILKRNTGHNRYVSSLLAGAAIFTLATATPAIANDLRIGNAAPVALKSPGALSPALAAPLSVQTAPNIVVNLDGLGENRAAPAMAVLDSGRRMLLMPGRDGRLSLNNPGQLVAAAGSSGTPPLRIQSESGLIELLSPDLVKQRRKLLTPKPAVKKPAKKAPVIPEADKTVPVIEEIAVEAPEETPADTPAVAQDAPAVEVPDSTAPVAGASTGEFNNPVAVETEDNGTGATGSVADTASDTTAPGPDVAVEPAPAALPQETAIDENTPDNDGPVDSAASGDAELKDAGTGTSQQQETVAEQTDDRQDGDDISDTLGEPGSVPETDVADAGDDDETVSVPAALPSAPKDTNPGETPVIAETVPQDSVDDLDEKIVVASDVAKPAALPEPLQTLAAEAATATKTSEDVQPAPLPAALPETTAEPVDTAGQAQQAADIVANTASETVEAAADDVVARADKPEKVTTTVTETIPAVEESSPVVDRIVDATPETPTVVAPTADAPAIAVPDTVPDVASGGPRPLGTGETKANVSAIAESAPVNTTPAEAPAEAASLEPAGDAADILPNVFAGPNGVERLIFSADNATIDAEGARRLADIAKWAKAEGSRLRLMAYANDPDNRSQSARRLALSRALVVRSQLIEFGLDSAMIEVRALGLTNDQEPGDRVDIQALLTQ